MKPCDSSLTRNNLPSDSRKNLNTIRKNISGKSP